MEPMKRSLEDIGEGEMNTISLKIHKFEIFDSMLYVFCPEEYIQYVTEYIDTVKAGNPDKETVIRKFIKDNQEQGMTETAFDRMLVINRGMIMGNSSPIRIISYLNKIESDIHPIVDAIKRENKIDEILGQSHIDDK